VPVRALAALAACAVLAGCAGGEDEAAPPPAPALRDEVSFTEAVLAAVSEQTDYDAESETRLEVRASAGLDAVTLHLEDEYARYRREPEGLEALVDEAVADVERRLEGGISSSSFADVRPHLMPLLKPVFELRRLEEAPARRRVAPSLFEIFVVDDGEAFTLVTAADLDRWRKTIADLEPIANANLARRTEPLSCEEELCGWAIDDGYDATRMLVPQLRQDIREEIGEAAYAVPMEKVFVAVPIAFAERIRQKVLQDFTTADEPVSPDVFVERGGRLVPLPS
jgi:uncharacterized protein YtpQ (UPF0354 family)